MIRIGDNVVCIDTDSIHDGDEYKCPVYKIKLNGKYTIREVNTNGYMLIGFENDYHKSRFMPLAELRKKKLECLTKVIK